MEGDYLARGELVALGLILMLVVAPVFAIMGFFFFLFGGFLLMPLAVITGIIGFILLIVGLVSHSDIERAALARQAATPMAPPQPSPYVKCPSCRGENYPNVKFCNWCGKELFPKEGI